MNDRPLFRPGDHIKARVGIYEHHGICLSDDTVIHFSGVAQGKDAATIRVGTLDRFAGTAGRSAIRVVDYARSFSPAIVLQRAYSQLGRSGYDAFRNNCEHFARWCKTGQFASAQAETVMHVTRGAGATATTMTGAMHLVSAAGAVRGANGAGLMSGLSTIGRAVGGSSSVGIAALAIGPSLVAAHAARRVFRDDPLLQIGERRALLQARRAAQVGAVAASLGMVGAVSVAGVPGLSAVGISTGLKALGGSMFGGIVAAMILPVAAASGLAAFAYHLSKPPRGATP